MRINRTTKRWIIGGLVLGGIFAVSNSGKSVADTDGTTPVKVTVSRVIDGDTVQLNDGRHIRLLGANTPEKGQCGWVEATQFAKNFFVNESVDASGDSTQDVNDKYGRTLLYLSVNHQDYSIAVVEAGWAVRYVYNNKPVQKDADLQLAQQHAQYNHRGIWGKCGRTK